MLPKLKSSGRPRKDNRLVFENILWILRTGARWKDLPEKYPSPSTCWRRLKLWEEQGVWEKIWHIFIKRLDKKGQIDWAEVFMDGTFVSAKKKDPKVGKTKRGKGSKLMAVADGRSIPLGVFVASASPHEVTLIEKTIDQLGKTPEHLVGDKAYDSDAFRARLKERGIELVAPPRRNKRVKLQDGRALRRYRHRWKIERTIAWFGNYRHLVTRWERNDKMYQAFLHIACGLITCNNLWNRF